MDSAFLTLIAVVLGGTITGALVHTWQVHRRILRLEYRVSDLEDRNLVVRNREKANKRWDKEQTIEEDLEKLIGPGARPVPSRPVRRYDNEPLGIED